MLRRTAAKLLGLAVAGEWFLGTLPKHHHGTTRNAYPVECGYCGVPFPRNQMRKDASGLWVCPDEGKGRDRTLLDRLNARIKPFRGPRPADAPTHTYSATADAAGIYVSSENGSDDWTGDSSHWPFRTLNRALREAHSANAQNTLYLERGSAWHEELTGLPLGSEVRAYGTGENPIVDGRDVAVNAIFVAVGGATPHVYSILWSHNFDDAGGKCKHRAWENGTMLTRAASLAACESTAGTFYAGTPTTGGPDTIYVHPNGNTDPRSDGKEYSFTKRRWAIQLYDYTSQASVYDIDSIGNAHADGSLIVDGYAEGCVARDGRVHNGFIRGEAVECTALRTDQTEDYAMFVSYMNAGGPSANGRNTIFRRCTADTDGVTAIIGSGFYVHTDGVNQFGTLQYEDCEVIGCSGGWGGIQVATAVMYRCSYSNVLNVYSVVGNTRTVILGGAGFTRTNPIGNNNDNRLFSYDTSAVFALIVQGVKCRRLGSGQGPIYVDAANCTIMMKRCTISSAIEMQNKMRAGNWTFSSNIITKATGVAAGNGAVLLGNGSSQVAAFTANGNCYFCTASGGDTWTTTVPGIVSYTTLATWRAFLAGLGFGPETTSIERIDPQLADPANLDFTVGNATVISLGAGAEQDEEDDAALQALWNLYKVS